MAKEAFAAILCGTMKTLDDPAVNLPEAKRRELAHVVAVIREGFARAIRHRRDCQEFRVWAGIMGKKETHYVSTQGAGDSG